ncbi:MAG: hypothetical protein WCR82_06310 [Bacteroidales bacterium]|jgi:phosphate/sulfate permease/DNA-binding CsgD family transcriptional regulator
MIMPGAIIALSLIGYWMLRVDYPVAFAPIIAGSALKKKSFKLGMLIVTIATLLLVSLNYIPSIKFEQYLGISEVVLFVAVAVAFGVEVITYKISKFPPICYSFMGALMGCQLFITGSVNWDSILRVTSSWLIAPVIGLVLGAVFYKIYMSTIGSLSVNLYKLNVQLKHFVLAGSIFISIALALNNGSVLLFISNVIPNSYGVAILAVVVVLLFLLFQRKSVAIIYKMVDREFDINFPASISIIFSTSIVLLLFSFNRIVSFIGLTATPLSVPSVMFLSLIGVGIVQNKEKIERSTLRRMVISLVLSPILAIIISYSICSLLGMENLLAHGQRWVKNGDEVDLNLVLFLSIALIGAIMLFFFNFQQKSKEMNQHASMSHQQFIYENQRALNALEIKTILAENHSLHNRLEQKRKEVIDVALNISEQKEFLETIYDKIKSVDGLEDSQKKDEVIKEVEQILFQRMSFSQEIDGFYTQVEKLHKDFSINLKEKFPNLTVQEKRLATLLRLGFSTKEISTLMNISVKSGEISRYRLRKKLNLSREDNLIRFIKTL